MEIIFEGKHFTIRGGRIPVVTAQKRLSRHPRVVIRHQRFTKPAPPRGPMMWTFEADFTSGTEDDIGNILAAIPE